MTIKHAPKPPRNPFTAARPPKAQGPRPAVFRCPCCGAEKVHL